MVDLKAFVTANQRNKINPEQEAVSFQCHAVYNIEWVSKIKIILSNGYIQPSKKVFLLFNPATVSIQDKIGDSSAVTQLRAGFIRRDPI